MKPTVDILEDFINTLVFTIDVNSFSDDGTNTTMLVDNTYQVRDAMVIDVDGTDYKVVSIIFNQQIVVTGVIVDPKLITVAAPFYAHGTVAATNQNIIVPIKHADRLPMIYLHEIIKEKDMNVNSSIGRESELRMFFLDSANFGDWNTDDHYEKVLLGLNSLVDQFEASAIDNIRQFYLFATDWTRINHAKWGTYKDNSGHIKNLFDDELTGVELSFTLPLKRDCNN